MIYDVPAITVLARECAPEIATEAVVPLVVTESGGDAFAVNVNKGPRVRAGSVVEGAAIVRRYMAAGYTVEQVFEPCTNLRLASTVLQQGYELATRYYSGFDAISATYSLYNTGTLKQGFRNGYVGRVWTTATNLGSIHAPPPIPVATPQASVQAPQAPSSARDRETWVIGQVATAAIEVFK